MTFQNPDDSEFTLPINASNEARVSLLSSATGTLPDYLADTTHYYWFNDSAPNRILYFKYSVCANDPVTPFPAFAQNRLSVIDSRRYADIRFSRQYRRRRQRHQSALQRTGSEVAAAYGEFRIFDVCGNRQGHVLIRHGRC